MISADVSSLIFDGSFVLAALVALAAGVVSFASPCVLPLLPGYVGLLSGLSGPATQGTNTERGSNAERVMVGAQPVRATDLLAARASAPDAAAPSSSAVGAGPVRPAAPTGRLLGGTLLFVAGFSAVFIILSVVVSAIGLAVLPWMDTIMRIAGVLVIAMGLVFLGWFPRLQIESHPNVAPRAGLAGAPVLGAVFGLGWAPCIGPTLAAVLTLSLGGANPERGVALAVAYCIGLGLPFVVMALIFARSATVFRAISRHRRTIQQVGAALLIVLGILLVTGLWQDLAGWFQGIINGFEPPL